VVCQYISYILDMLKETSRRKFEEFDDVGKHFLLEIVEMDRIEADLSPQEERELEEARRQQGEKDTSLLAKLGEAIIDDVPNSRGWLGDCKSFVSVAAEYDDRINHVDVIQEIVIKDDRGRDHVFELGIDVTTRHPDNHNLDSKRRETQIEIEENYKELEDKVRGLSNGVKSGHGLSTKVRFFRSLAAADSADVIRRTPDGASHTRMPGVIISIPSRMVEEIALLDANARAGDIISEQELEEHPFKDEYFGQIKACLTYQLREIEYRMYMEMDGSREEDEFRVAKEEIERILEYVSLKVGEDYEIKNFWLLELLEKHFPERT